MCLRHPANRDAEALPHAGRVMDDDGNKHVVPTWFATKHQNYEFTCVHGLDAGPTDKNADCACRNTVLISI